MLLFGLVCVAAGCSLLPRRAPDLERLYASRPARTRYPVIVIPGVMGSRLRDRRSGREVWPGGFWNLLTGKQFPSLELAVGTRPATDLEVTGLFSGAFGRDYYANILQTLEGAGGYTCALPSEIDAATTCVVLPWDWRRDLVDAAVRLGAIIDELRRQRGDPDLKVDIVAHSAGGLIARYFVRYGARDVLDDREPERELDNGGAGAVRRLILVGTPNYGSVSALQRAIMGNDLGPGLATMQPEVLTTMPSLYELLPNPARTWMIDIHGKRLDIDLYDPQTWRRYRWAVFDPAVRRRVAARFADPRQANEDLRARERVFAAGLERAQRFHRALSAPLGSSPIEYVVFGGDCTPTPARCLLEFVNGMPMIRITPAEVVGRLPGVDYERLMLEPGDGRVTKASLLARDTLDPEADAVGFFPVAYAVFICRAHAELPSDITFRDNLLHILLY